jgi:hypothetical protein
LPTCTRFNGREIDSLQDVIETLCAQCVRGRPSLRLPNVPDNFGKDFICRKCGLRGSVTKAKYARAYPQ